MQPGNTVIIAGSNTSFSVNALGSGLTYQWQENSGLGFVNLLNASAYSNVTTATLNVNAAPISKNGYLYRCIVSGTCAPIVTSNSGILTVNSPYPAITSAAIKTVDEDLLYHYVLLATDATGNPLTYSALVKPAWLSFNPNTHVLSGVPSNSEVGVHKVTLRVSNGLLYSDQTFTITVKNQNDAPIIMSSARTTINENEVYSYVFFASDIDANSILTYAAPIIPDWLTFNQVTGILSGTPSHEELGSHPVSLRVSDGSISVGQNFNIAVVDITSPTVTLSTSSGALINKSFNVIVDFSESVGGFVISDVTLVNGTGSFFTKISDLKFSFLVTPTRDGEVRIRIASNVAHDLSGNGNQTSVELTRQYDGTPPLATLSTDALNPTAKPFTVTFAFNEKVIGFTSQDIIATNASVSDFLNNGLVYSALITPAVNGMVTVAVEANSLTDLTGNSNSKSSTLEYVFDNVAPIGYEIQFGVDMVNVNNVRDILFDVRKAETSTYYFYSISSSTNTIVQKGTGRVQTETFTVRDLDLTELGDGDLTLTFLLVDEAGNKGADVITHINKITRDIISAAQQDTIRVPIHTPFTQFTIPDSLEVRYSNNQKQVIRVFWDLSHYNADAEGIYTLPGELKLAPWTTNLNHIQAEINVVVMSVTSPAKIFLSNSTFKSSIPSNEAIGIFTTGDENEIAHIYLLVNGDGDKDNDLFKIETNKLYLRSNSDISDFKEFSIRVRSRNLFGASIEEVFLLEKFEAESNKLTIKIPNTFSPDGDGINDRWIIKDLKDFTDVSISVFDRSGVPLYTSIDPNQGWDGSIPRGGILEGPFFYIVRINDVVKKGVLIVIK